MSESGLAPSPVTGIADDALQHLVEKGLGRDDRTVSTDEVLDVLDDLEPSPELIESLRASLAAKGVTLDDGVPDVEALTDEALTAPASPDEEIVVVVRDPALDDEGDDLVERRHKARFRPATRETVRLNAQSGGSSDPVRM